MLPYIVTIFLSAFLLFQVQPLLAKAILPWFGGSASVWTVCLMFFQVLLLLGYLYAHATTRHLAPKAQSLLHIGLLAVSLLFLPILPDAAWKPQGTEDPTFRIVLLLLVTVGLPYFLLSTTGSLLQAWFVRQRSDEQSMGGGVDGGERVVKSASPSSPSSASVYRLYAVSNAGSLLALLSYPVGVEPFLPTSLQAWVWSGGYLLFALMCGGIAWSARNAAPLQSEERTVEASVVEEGGAVSTEAAAKPEWKEHLLWALFVFTSTALLLSVTSHQTQNIAPVPFLWIVPLSLYLLSFIVCFNVREWRWHPVWYLLIPLGLAAMAFGGSEAGEHRRFALVYPLYSAGFFIGCMICHGELVRSKPDPRYLTSYYLMISIGGALGGIFVGMMAPMLFNEHYELPIALILCATIALFRIYTIPARGWNHPVWYAAALGALGYFYFLGSQMYVSSQQYRLVERNFYGVLRVYGISNLRTEEHHRILQHGFIRHGVQILNPPERRREPTSYFGPYSGGGLALLSLENRPNAKVGIIGLGAGTLATYAKPGDHYRFYEINPLVLEIAQNEFTFLQDSPGDIEVVMGDARLSMEREEPQQYDVLIVDAFSGDAIPVHLLTREAFELYFRHLKPDGILAVHVSNRYLTLESVVERIASSLGVPARIVISSDRPEEAITGADWVLVTKRPGFFDTELMRAAAKPIPPRNDLSVWTDNSSNLFQILR